MASKPDPIKDQWLQVNDFSAGCINYAETTSATAHRLNPAPPGAADPSGTYSCVALPSGGLGALPELSASYPWGGASSGAHTAYLVGFLVHDELTNGDTEAYVISEYDDGTNHHWQAYSFILETTSWNLSTSTSNTTSAGLFGSPYPAFTRVNLTQIGSIGTPVTLTSGSSTITYAPGWGATTAGNSITIYGVYSGAPTIPFDTIVLSVVGTTLTMSNPIGGTSGTGSVGISSTELPGHPVIAFPAGGPAEASSNGQVFIYPDPANPSAGYGALPLISGASSVSGQVVCHQNRILVLSGVDYAQTAGGGFNTNENINFTDPPNSASLGFQQTVLQAEDPFGYGGASSVSAGELFIIKKRGGAVVVAGDIFSPNVTFYPGVQPTGGFFGQAGAGSLGVFYCSWANGAWLWNGGNTSEKISLQLDDNFYLPEEFFGGIESSEYGYFVQCIGDKAYFSNNWIYDMTLRSWWIYYPQAGQGGTNLFWVNPVSGRYIYAANLSFTGTNDFMYQFDTETPAQTFQWTSLPLRLATNYHVCDIRQLYVRASCTAPNCTVTVGILDQGNLVFGPVAMTGDFTNGPEIIRFNTGEAVALQAPQIRLKFENSSPGDMAILHEWGINYDVRAPIPENN